jgi:predicted negative regulator of RcsB-dependent stress response
VAAFEQAIITAGTAGDLRIVALARTRLARVLRALGRTDEARAQLREARRWYRTGGGGDGALLADHLAAALDADEGSLRRLLDADDPEIRLLTLDALAAVSAQQGRAAEAVALLAEADGLVPAVAHLVSDDDRIDRRQATSIMSGSP